MAGLPLAFTVPLVLGALVLLPVLYYLLRVTPPRPQTVPFPPLRLILDLTPRQETPARTPLWLLLLRLAMAAAVILAMAGPIWDPTPALEGGRGPVAVIIDDGLAAAPDWDQRIAAAADRVRAAEHAGRLTAVVAISDGERSIQAAAGAQTLERLRALKPQPLMLDRMSTLPAVRAFVGAAPDAALIWITDGLENGNAQAFATAMTKAAPAHPLTIVGGAPTLVAIAEANNKPDALDARVVRAGSDGSPAGRVRAFDLKGAVLGEAAFDFGDSTQTHASLTLPVELRNDVARLAVDGVSSAGAVNLLDSRGQRRRIGLVSGTTADLSQPLLSPTFYIARALAPYADIRQSNGGSADPIGTLLDEDPSVMILADLNIGSGADHDRLVQFVENGGVLVRFAGARLAGAADDLVPVSLRKGGRTFGGALSWDQPKALAPFEPPSPFYGLQPHDAVTVTRQVLAEPEPGLPEKTWAQLIDGTPLVTAQKRGKGTVILFHITADTTWSNLPLSGLFVDMLRRIVDLAVATPKADANGKLPPKDVSSVASLAPNRILDGFGDLGPPPTTARPILATGSVSASLDHPPGYYGPTDAQIAVNPLAPDIVLTPAALSGKGWLHQTLAASQPIDLRGALIAAAMIALLVDTLATLWLSGGVRRRRAAAIAAGLALALYGIAAFAPPPAQAEDVPAPAISKQDLASALSVRLAYVVSGDSTVDSTSREGLTALSRAIGERTSLSPGEPIGVDPTRDELAFYPLLYWPIVSSAAKPSAAAIGRIAAYMKQGGTIVFDTRDAMVARLNGPPTPEGAWLRDLLAGVDVPEIEPLPADHVVTRTFYILAGFVGRYATGQTWIEALPPPSPDEANRPARAGDSVSPIVITGNDLAGAWASTSDGQPLFPLVPGGPRQRELAIRGGVNLVMYTLTGNYKADQVHVRDLLERLAR